MKKGTNAQVIQAFIAGYEMQSGSMTAKVLKGSNNSITVLYSYNAIIAYKWNGRWVVTNHKYSVTTSKQTNQLIRELPTHRVDRADLDTFSPLAKVL